MAVSKKVVEQTKAAAPKAEVKKTAVKAQPVKETVKKEEPIKKEAAKKAPAKEKAATPAKKAPAKKTAAKKAELKSVLNVQFEGKSYSQEDLIQIAKDVWKYDLNQKDADLKSVELYVKPEESMVYYVMNEEFTGSFYI